jgi:hypothetical protein
MAHIVLLGDSIFDNKTYVGSNGKDVVTHLRESLPSGSNASLKAVDGSLIENVAGQLSDLPSDTTHLIVSVGGNNALMNSDVLQMRAGSSAEVLSELAKRREIFESQYEKMLHKLLEKNFPAAVCTIYFPNFSELIFQRVAVTALSVFNDAIIRQAIVNNLPIIDLRLVCNESADYANEIEPSDKGGRKIAAKILELINKHQFSNHRTEVFH